MIQTTTLLSKSNILLTVLALVLGSMYVSADTIEEDFEDVTIVDANGNELANSWTAGAGLSNGWRIIGGSIYANDNGDYGLIKATGMGFEYSDCYLTSSSTSVNSASVFIPTMLQGQVILFAKSNLTDKSKKTSYLRIYEATADGSVTSTLLFSASPEKGNGQWKYYTFTLDEGKYIAINMVYTDLDNFSATIADGSQIVPTLSVSTETLDFGTVQRETVKTFTVRSNITTEVAFSIDDNDAGIFQMKEFPNTIIAGETTTIAVKMNAQQEGQYAGVLTVTAGELSKTIALSGQWEVPTVTPGVPTDWKGEDFNGYKEDDPIPAGWTVEGDWHVGEPFLLDTPAAVITSGSGTMITPFFTVTSHQGLSFYFSKTAIGWNSYSSKIEVSYSNDMTEWTVAATYDKYESDGVKIIPLPTAGNFYVRFATNDRTYLDDIQVVDVTETGIGSVRADEADSGVSYDLQGRQTKGLRRGLYIQNGKKYIRN